MEPQLPTAKTLAPDLYKDGETDSIHLKVNWGGKRVEILENSLLDADGTPLPRILLEQLVHVFNRGDREKLEKLFQVESDNGLLFAKLINYKPVDHVTGSANGPFVEGVVIPPNLKPISEFKMEWIQASHFERKYEALNPDWEPLHYYRRHIDYELKSFPRIHMYIREYTPEEIKERLKQRLQGNLPKKRRQDNEAQRPSLNLQQYKEARALVPDESVRVIEKYHLESAASKVSERDMTHYRAFMKIAWSFENYMNQALYNPEFGYYTTRSNQIGKEKNFQTAATDSPKIAFQIASQAFLMWKTMVQAGDISPHEPFTLLEVGAGTGVMAFNILTFLATHGIPSANPEYLQFYKNLRYVIVEISPELRKKQIENNQVWIDSGKMEIRIGDARRLTDSIQEKFKGAIISNELPDAFPVHQVRANDKGELEALSVIATVPKTLFNQYSVLFSPFSAKSDEYKKQFGDILGPEALNDFILAANEVLKLPKGVASQIVWKHVYIPLETIPELNEVKKQFGFELFAGLKQPIYINPHLTSFVNGAAEVLQEGFILTVDYGGAQSVKNNKRLDVDFRTYGKGAVQQDPRLKEFDSFGMVDLTTDVNFTMLAKAGADANFAPLVFTYQSHLSQVMKDSSSSVLSVEGCDKNFNLLIQQKNTTKAEYFVPVVNRELTYFDLFSNRSTNTTLAARVLVKAYLDFKNLKGIGENISDFTAYMNECYPEFEEAELIQQFCIILENYGSTQRIVEELRQSKQKDSIHIKDVLGFNPRDIHILEQVFIAINQKLSRS